MLVFAGTASALNTTAHDTLQGEMYVSSTANWDSRDSTNNFNVPNGTVVFARYYVGVWSATPNPLTLISTTFNGHAFPTNPSYYSTEMGVTWIPYDVTEYLHSGEINTATVNSKSWGDGRQYGSTLVVILKNESKPQIEYWIADGLDWMHYAEYVGYEVQNSTTYFNGTVNLSDVQSASLYSTHLTGFNYEDLNGKSLPTAAESVSGDYFNYLRWDNVQDLLVPENQTVLVSRGDDTYCAVGFNALSIVHKTPDLLPVSLTPSIVTANISNTMTATIENRGKDSSAFNVSLLVDGNIVDTQTVTSLAGENSTKVDFHWTPDGTVNSYTLTVNVDPENSVVESGESNNILEVLVGTSSALAPAAEFTSNTTSGNAPLTVQFTDQSTNSTTSWLWDFGDGNTSTEQNPVHDYTIPRNYTVNLTASNAGGNDTKTKTDYISVSAITPVANFNAIPTSGTAPLNVQFTDTSANVPTSWAWDFENDGTIDSTEQNPSHTYTAGGKHTVNLTVGNAAGTDSEVKNEFITAYIPPVANFSGTPVSGNTPLTVTFKDLSENLPTSWLWDFGDGTTSTSQNPSHKYSYAGNYTVSLNVTNPAGSNSTIKANYITPILTVGPIWASAWEELPAGSPSLADLDGDGDFDLLISTNGYENIGNASSLVWTEKSAWNTPDTGSRHALADLDADGDHDLLIGLDSGITYGYENTGNASSPSWTRKSAWDVAKRTSQATVATPAFVDVDDDGDIDLFIGTGSGTIYGYENTGSASSPVWTAKSAWDIVPPSGTYNPKPAFSDLDGDGDYDLLIGSNSGPVYGYENTGNTNIPSWVRKSTWDAPTGKYMPRPAFADLDNDGDDDLLIGTSQGTHSYQNTGYIPATPPNANFRATPISGGVPLSVQFIDTSTKNPTSWAWDFENDGIIDSTEQNPSHSYTTIGSHTVNLTVSNSNGVDSRVKSGLITVYEPPVANFTADPISGNNPLTVTFTDTSTNISTSWSWDFGDGTTSTSQNPVHRYSIAGTYTVNLTVTNPAGSNFTARTDYITVLATEGPVWTANSSWNTPNIGSRSVPAFSDLDGDGDNDLLIGAYDGITYGYENTGNVNSPSWSAKSAWNAPDIGTYASPSFADLDSDGDYDLVIGAKDGITYVYENTGDIHSPSWSIKSAWNSPSVGTYAAPSLTDLDDDGDFDLLIGAYDGITYGFENTGSVTNPSWTAKSEWNVADIGSRAGPALTDLDGDNDYDLVIGTSDGITYGYENTGNITSPIWTAKSAWNLADIGSYAKPAFADLDSDGDYDLLIGELSGYSYGYQNTGYLPPTVPRASFICIPTSGKAPLVVNFTDRSTKSPTSWNWDFENDGIFDSTEQNPSYTYTMPGTYTVKLTAMNSVGSDNATKTDYIMITEVVIIPIASFTANVTSGTAPLTVNFTDTSSNTPTSWLWDFGDGSNSTEQNVSHTYTSAGDYTVNLTVANEGGNNSEVKTEYIVVSEPLPDAPVSNFTANQTSGTAPLDVQFADASTGTVSSYAWDFDNDGTVDSSEQNPVYTYVTAGSYTVNLTVANEAGSNSTVKANYITVNSTETNDLTIGSMNTVPGNAVFAREANTLKITNIKNTGTETLTNISLALYASDVSDGTVPVNTTTIDSLASGGTVTLSLIDPTIRNLEGDTVTYTAVVDSDNLISETNEANNNASVDKPVKYNGYKGKRYWEGGSDITTKEAYDLQGNLLYSTQPSSAYKGVGWTDRTETWTASDFSIPNGSTVEKVLLYVSYNWDTTPGGVPKWTATFNGNTLTNGTLYTDKSNFGTYANYTYGLYVFDVTDQFNTAGNSLILTSASGNSNALYPSTLVVVYRDPNETMKQIFINDECDELAYSPTSYGTTLEEATAYAPFTGMPIETEKVRNATLYSFAGSAGPNEGNLLFNGNKVASNAWQGTSSTSSAQVFDVKNYINATGNEAGIQETVSGGMNALQQILVVEYQKEQEAAPVANFTANVTTGTAPLDVQFTDASTGNVSSYAWDFDNDGNVDSSEQNPVHTYAVAGNYTVNLTVIGPEGSDSEVKTEYINVSGPSPENPVAAFSASPTSGKTPLTVTFTDKSSNIPTKWNWSFGDGTISFQQNPTHKYSAAGKYTVILTVTNAKGSNTVTETDYVKVIAKPVSNFTSSVTSGKAPLNVKFADTSTGTASSWIWEFGDGSKSFLQNPTHKYSKAGTYTVNLTVKNAAGRNTVTKTEHIKVTAKPVANFTSSVTSGKAPLNVKFTDTSTGTPATWKWDFGDGITSTQQNPVHKYSKAGTYTVILTVKNAVGSNTVTKTDYIKVTEKPVAEFSATPTSGKPSLTVTFFDTSTGLPTKWKWNFGDGASSTIQNPKHKYSKAGSYTVTLTATNTAGSNTITKTGYVKITA